MTRPSKSSGPGDPAPSKSAQQAKKLQDDQVMSTNNSSIVSKRSVEKLYHPGEAHYFRHFVRKFQRRAPLINRGYWLRMRVVDTLVRDFLRGSASRATERENAAAGRESKKRAVVVNLGCGSDALPWQCLARYPESCAGANARFVDVDFPDLIARKRETVLNTPDLRGPLTGLKESVSPGAGVVLESDQYVQVGCDLRDLKTLRRGLEVAAGGRLEECRFLFVAEVSITYMETAAADEVIRFASTVGDAEFVLLEQILPDGPSHPFAATMLSHFTKLGTPLKSVDVYPTVDDQHARFASCGWPADQVCVWTLWQAWADARFLQPADRTELDKVEPFDEWEEFAIFACHYCVVHARVGGEGQAMASPTKRESSIPVPIQAGAVRFDECQGQRGQRRFAAAMRLDGGEGTTGRQPTVLLNVLGLGTKSRLQSCDVFGLGGEAAGDWQPAAALREGGPTPRMCHTLTDLGKHGVLLAGGRESPSSPFKDCWLFDKETSSWRRTHDLPVPLYRHAATALGDSGLALLLGGRGKSEASDACLLYHPEAGWIECDVAGARPPAAYGAAVACGSGSDGGVYSGILTGGITDGLVSDRILGPGDRIVGWEVDVSDIKKPTITFTKLKGSSEQPSLAVEWLLKRFGATCFPLGNHEFVLLGGVTRDTIVGHQDEIIIFSVAGDEVRLVRRLEWPAEIPRPLLAGHSAVILPDSNSVVIVGGGATCFSMGTHWNKGVYTIRLQDRLGVDGEKEAAPAVSAVSPRWVHQKTIDILPGEKSFPPLPTTAARTALADGGSSAEMTPIPRVKLDSADDFERILRADRPVVIEGLNLGSCVSAWTLDYLVDKVGADRKVVIHEAASQVMDFTSKNFKYVTAEFEEFARRAGRGDRLYLRALSRDKPSEKPALLADDFPTLAEDFVLPPQLAFVKEKLFSSVLRMSGPVNMWLHYDVMANVYCQIGGSKRMLLFPPSDVERLSFAPGASSSGVDVFSLLDKPELARTHPHEAVVSPGDVLFLPRLWLHTATPIGGDVSIAVNVFFRDLDNAHYASGRDVYGNRDLAAYEKGRQDVARIANSFKKLPAEAREFYLLRLADELRERARTG
ncbi:hypothetical protein VTJ83DRAFT_6689 [Remersonia thermophila]|uniref:tRNA wybutosine-synthesizing protein 4 n=1 Tax=Remersonia thermophila TaxID=72144 RepID=A0ABR4D7M2_9PEZI